MTDIKLKDLLTEQEGFPEPKMLKAVNAQLKKLKIKKTINSLPDVDGLVREIVPYEKIKVNSLGPFGLIFSEIHLGVHLSRWVDIDEQALSLIVRFEWRHTDGKHGWAEHQWTYLAGSGKWLGPN